MTRWLLVLVVAACGANPGGAIRWSEPVEIASGRGIRGPWQQNDSHFDYVDDPSAAIRPDGDVGVVWVDQREKDVLWQIITRDGRRVLPVPLDVSRTSEVFSWLPRVAVAPHGPDIYVVWQEIVFSGGSHGGDIFFARSRDGGLSFEAPLNLSRSRAGDGKGRIDAEHWHNGSFDLAVDTDGEIYVAWTSYEGELRLCRSRDGGATFEDPILVATGTPLPARAPALAVARGALYLAWTVGEDARADIRIAVSRDGRSFGPPVIVARTPSYSDAPKVAIDARGTLHIAWGETANSPFDPAEVFYTRSHDGTTFERVRAISRPHARGVAAGFPALAVDGERVVVTWEHYDPDDAPRGLGIAYSLDGGATFSPPALIANTRDRGTNGSQQGRLARKLALRGDTIVVVNSALRPGEASRVWLVRGRFVR